MSLQQDMAKAKSITLELEKDLTRCIALLAIWDRANDKKDIKSRYDNTYEAHALSMIQDSLHITMIMALMRMYDSDKRSASIPTLIKLLGSQSLLVELKNSSLPQRNNIDEWLRSVRLRYARLRKEETLISLRRLRNFALAHSDIKKSSLHGAKYGYERNVLKRTIPIVEQLLLIVHSRELRFSEVRGIWKRYSNEFWSSAANSPKR